MRLHRLRKMRHRLLHRIHCWCLRLRSRLPDQNLPGRLRHFTVFPVLALYLVKTKSAKEEMRPTFLFSSSLLPVHLSVCPKTTAFVITRFFLFCQYPMQGKSAQTAFKFPFFSIFCPVLVLLFSLPAFFCSAKSCFFLYNGVTALSFPTALLPFLFSTALSPIDTEKKSC